MHEVLIFKFAVCRDQIKIYKFSYALNIKIRYHCDKSMFLYFIKNRPDFNSISHAYLKLKPKERCTFPTKPAAAFPNPASNQFPSRIAPIFRWKRCPVLQKVRGSFVTARAIRAASVTATYEHGRRNLEEKL